MINQRNIYICFMLFFLFVSSFHFVITDDNRKAVSNALIVTDGKDSGDNEDVTVSVDDDIPEDIFQPSKNWKPIKEGQAIPKGLHVRINLQTGEKEGRILQEPESNEELNDEPPSPNTLFSPHELKEALKAIKSEDISTDKPQVGKRKLRSLQELKKEFGELNLNIKSETDILIDLLGRYTACKNDEDKLTILKDLEYIAHQFDVAQDLVHLDGLQILLPDLNSSVTNVRSLVCATLGAAMQGNPKVQVAVLEQNGLSILMRVVVLDPFLSVRVKALYALSCLLRNFPFAQQRLLDNGGIQLMASILQEDISADPNALKIKLKVITLLNDLLVEQDFAGSQLSSTDKASNNHPLSLRRLLVQHGFCNLVGDLLSVPGVEVKERIISAMKIMSPDCTFRKQLPDLLHLSRLVENSVSQEETDDEQYQLLENIKLLVKNADRKDEL